MDSVIQRAKDKVIPRRFILDNTVLPINKNVRFYDYTNNPTLKNVRVRDGVYHYSTGGDGYMKMKVENNENNYKFEMYLTCNVNSGSFYPTFMVKESDYKKMMGLEDPLSKKVNIGDKPEEVVELTNKDFFGFIDNMLNTKKAKTYCTSFQLDYSSTDDKTNQDTV
jgi:hypothetical protein